MDMPPLRSEQPMQSAIPRNDAGRGCMPLLIRMAVTQVVNPIIFPTDISKCPDMMRIVIPAATSPRLADWDMMLLILVQLKNFAFIDVVTIPMMIINANRITGCETRSLPIRLFERTVSIAVLQG
jgi:hypothetical protein